MPLPLPPDPHQEAPRPTVPPLQKVIFPLLHFQSPPNPIPFSPRPARLPLGPPLAVAESVRGVAGGAEALSGGEGWEEGFVN
jgi:hypothetical protein